MGVEMHFLLSRGSCPIQQVKLLFVDQRRTVDDCRLPAFQPDKLCCILRVLQVSSVAKIVGAEEAGPAEPQTLERCEISSGS